MTIQTSDGEVYDDAFEHAKASLDKGWTKVAGDVLPMEPREQWTNTQGPTDKSAPYAWGVKKDPNIKPIPIEILNQWMQRMTNKR